MLSTGTLLAPLLLGAMRFELEAYEPKADEKATVIASKTRFTVLTPRLLRMEYSEAGFEDRPTLAFVNRKQPVPTFRWSNAGDGGVLTTDSLKLTYTGGPFTASSLVVEPAPGSTPLGQQASPLGGVLTFADQQASATIILAVAAAATSSSLAAQISALLASSASAIACSTATRSAWLSNCSARAAWRHALACSRTPLVNRSSLPEESETEPRSVGANQAESGLSNNCRWRSSTATAVTDAAAATAATTDEMDCGRIPRSFTGNSHLRAKQSPHTGCSACGCSARGSCGKFKTAVINARAFSSAVRSPLERA